jgi:hypothetical protein
MIKFYHIENETPAQDSSGVLAGALNVTVVLFQDAVVAVL